MNVKRSSSSIAADGVVERRRMLGLEDGALRLERREVVERQHVAQARQRAALAPRPSPTCFVVLAEHADRLRVVEDVRDVLRRAVGVDGRADGADLGEREVEQRPLERRAREVANASPFRTPRASRPFARFSTRSAASAQVTSCQWSPCWTR